MFNSSLQSVFIYTYVHDGKVLCHSYISETSTASPFTLNIYCFSLNINSNILRLYSNCNYNVDLD
jgi:hypothetical protein